MSNYRTQPSPNSKVSKDDKSHSPNSKSSRSKHDAIVKKEENYLARCTNYRLTSGYEVTICNCKHICKIRIGERHSICNPQRWLCDTCFTTDSVWACLSCPNVACGRYIKEHALTHFQETGHPLAIDVNELYVYCYKCDDYVLNDNNASDIKVLREMLLAIRYQNFTGTTRSGHTLRSAVITEKEDLEMRRKMQQDQLDRDDRLFTAIWHSRFVRQRKAFRRWLRFIKCKRTSDDYVQDSNSDQSEQAVPDVPEEISILPGSYPESSDSPAMQSIGDNTTENISRTSVIADGETPCATEHTSLPSTSPITRTDCDVETNSLVVSEKICKKNEVTLTDNKDAPNLMSKEQNVICDDKLLCINETKQLPADAEHESVEQELLSIGVHTKSSDTTSVDYLESTGNELMKDHIKTEDSPAPKPLNILTRPRRSNAAGRYKEIFNSLGISHLKRDISCPIPSQGHADEPPTKRRNIDAPKQPGRRSDRIRKIERAKEIAAKRRQPRPKKSFRLSTQKRRKQQSNPLKKRFRKSVLKSANSAFNSYDSCPYPGFRLKNTASSNRTVIKRRKSVRSDYRPSRARRLISGLTETNKRTHSYQPPNLYDNVPNKAVTSLIPGVTGLRNLGNTCYLNSIIQVLGHLQKFRLCLLGLREMEIKDSYNSKGKDNSCFATPHGKALRALTRRTTVELYNEQVKPKSTSSTTRNPERKKSGLNGGRSPQESETQSLSPLKSNHSPSHSGMNYWSSSLSLCNELDHLYQVMWSGKWKLVSPYHFLHSVWSLIPSFRGYTQQDAQEFLCELLDKIVSELRKNYTDSKTENNIAKRILRGRLKSEVRCLECSNVSSTVEPFWDLSLEFPERYHKISAKRKSSSCGNSRPGTVPSDPCSLHEMLENFTATETLDGGRVYGCSKCNSLHQNQSGSGGGQKKKSIFRKYSQLLTEAEKQLKIFELPQVLRFHLKRFRWIGRNHREKISVHVDFPSELDMRRYCWKLGKNDKYMYDLSAVVMHHGRGFGSGHYTANCWNGTGEFWVHCNDSNLELCSIEDVMASQAYILFYTLRGIDPQPHLFSPPLTPTVASPRSLSPVVSDSESAEDADFKFLGTESG